MADEEEFIDVEEIVEDLLDEDTIYEGLEDDDEEEEEDEDEISLYEQLFYAFQKVQSDLADEGMEDTIGEWERLWDAANEWKDMGDSAAEKLEDAKNKLVQLEAQNEDCKDAKEKLRVRVLELSEELETAQKLADCANAREIVALETALGLRNQLTDVSKDVDHKIYAIMEQIERKVSKGYHMEAVDHGKLEEQAEEELHALRERLEHSLSHSQSLEQRYNEREKEIERLQELLDAQEITTGKQMKLKERLTADLQKTKTELEAKEEKEEELREQRDATAKELRELRNDHKDLMRANERVKKDHKALESRNKKLAKEVSRREAELTVLRRDARARTHLLRDMEMGLRHARKEASEATRGQAAAERRAEAAAVARGDAEREARRLRINTVGALENELQMAREATRHDAVAMRHLRRDKDMIAKSLDRCHEITAEQNQALRLQEKARQATNNELDKQVVAARRQSKEITELRLERDRLDYRTTELELKVQEALEDVRLKHMQLHDAQRRVDEGVMRLHQHENLHDAVREDRNTLAKQLIEVHEELLELRHKLKVQDHHVEQLKEDAACKEVELRHGNKELMKMEREKEKLRMVLETAKSEMFPGRAQVVAAAAALARERRLMGFIEQGDKERRLLETQMKLLVAEREVLGGQLVRRNDELSLLYQKMNLLSDALHRGEVQYDKRLEDTRLLKIEVQRLRNEKVIMQNMLTNMADLRKEVFHLERDLARERMRRSALQDELQNPMNVHRWRKLKGTDPLSYELIDKVHVLQKRLVAQSAAALERETQVQEAMRLYVGLRKILVNQPGPEILMTLRRTQEALRRRGRRIKVLVADACILAAELAEEKGVAARSAISQNEMAVEQRRLRAREKAARKAAATARQRLTAFKRRCAPALLAMVLWRCSGGGGLWSGDREPRRHPCPSRDPATGPPPPCYPAPLKLALVPQPGSLAQQRAEARAKERAARRANAPACWSYHRLSPVPPVPSSAAATRRRSSAAATRRRSSAPATRRRSSAAAMRRSEKTTVKRS